MTMNQPAMQIQSIDMTTLIKRCDEQMTADLGGELAILNTRTGTYFGLNQVGSHVWDLLKETRTLKEIRDSILDEYAVEPSQCEQDLLRLITELAQHELVEIGHAPDRQI